MSEFEKKYPKPIQNKLRPCVTSFKNAVWKLEKAVWLECLKWVWKQRTSNDEHISFVKIKKEIAELEKDT